MPWPEKDFITRLLAGLVGAVLGAFLGFISVARGYFTLHSPTVIVLYAAVIGAVAGFLLAFVFGDAAVRFLGRLV